MFLPMSPIRFTRGHFRPLGSGSVLGHGQRSLDQLVAADRAVKRVDARARRLAARLGAHPPARLDLATWIAYEDSRLLQRVVRQEACFDLGWALGSVAGAALSLRQTARPARGGQRRADDARAADALALSVTELALTAPVARPRAAAVLLEIARALVLGAGDRARDRAGDRARRRRAVSANVLPRPPAPRTPRSSRSRRGPA